MPISEVLVYLYVCEQPKSRFNLFQMILCSLPFSAHLHLLIYHRKTMMGENLMIITFISNNAITIDCQYQRLSIFIFYFTTIEWLEPYDNETYLEANIILR